MVEGQTGELSFTITIQRKDTGKTETYQMVSVEPVAIPQIEGESDVSNSIPQ